MIEVVINYDASSGLYKVYEPSSDTLLATTSLSESMTKLSEFLVSSGLTKEDILHCPDISYHLDSHTMLALIESNVGLLKRLNTAPSGFESSSRRFGLSNSSSGKSGWDNNSSFSNKKWKGLGDKKDSFNSSYRRFKK